MIRDVVTTRDRIRIHYRRLGQGPGLVLLHGYPQTGHMWRKVLPALAGRFTVAAPDLRGYGDSDRPAGGYDKRWGAGRAAQAQDMLGVWKARCASTLEGFSVPDCGHFIPEERPEVLIDAIMRFAGVTT